MIKTLITALACLTLLASPVLAARSPRDSIVVTASKSLMPEIEAVIQQLDANPANKQHIFAVSLKNADPQDVANILQDLFPASSTSRNSSSANSSQTSPLATRSSTLLQQSFQSSQNSSSSLGSSSSGGRSGP